MSEILEGFHCLRGAGGTRLAFAGQEGEASGEYVRAWFGRLPVCGFR